MRISVSIEIAPNEIDGQTINYYRMYHLVTRDWHLAANLLPKMVSSGIEKVSCDFSMEISIDNRE